MFLEALVVELVINAILSGNKLTYKGITNAIEASPEYHGTRRGKSLEKEVRSILQQEEVLKQIRESISTDNNIHAGIKIGRLEINGKWNLD